jgi:hypothetical protein
MPDIVMYICCGRAGRFAEPLDGAPKPLLEKVNKETADKAKEALEAAGATVSVK